MLNCPEELKDRGSSLFLEIYSHCMLDSKSKMTLN